MLALNDNYKEIINNTKYAIVKFGAPWCASCKSLDPVLEDVKEKLHMCDFYYIDLSNANSAEYCTENNIKTIPMVALYNYGDLVTKLGVRSSEEYVHTFLELINTMEDFDAYNVTI